MKREKECDSEDLSLQGGAGGNLGSRGNAQEKEQNVGKTGNVNAQEFMQPS